MAERPQIDPAEFDHWLYHALVGRLEWALGLEPCSAIKLAGKLTNGLTAEAMKIWQASELEMKRDG